MRPSVVIAGGSAPARAGLRLVLEREGFDIAEQAANATELLAAASAKAPDLLVVSMDLPGGALVVLRRLAGGVPAMRIVVLASHPTSDELLDAVLCGASGYLSDDVAAARLPHVLRAVLRGEPALPRQLSGRLLAELRGLHRRHEGLAPRLRARLTDREWEMVEHLHDGRSTAEIALRLGIAEVTVRRHISSLLAKLGVPDRTSAVALIRDALEDARSRE